MPQQGPTRPLRALAPRTTLTAEGAAASGPATEESKTKRASTACKECKRRRTKCSTGNPCTECASHDRECVYDESADKRRKVAARRTQEQLGYYKGVLERLLDSIRYCERAEIDQIIDVIRGGASLDDISTVIEQSLSGRPADGKKDHEEDQDEDESDLMDEMLEDVS